jgi:hypothetical protein
MPVSARVRQRVAEQARGRCGYCQTQEVVSGIPLTVDHIRPQSRGGLDVEENLWMACRLCNEAKAALTETADPESGDVVPLFNPRTQVWVEHFSWTAGGTAIYGLTAQGRATVKVLGLNSDLRIRARALWVEAGFHPPD